jgi:hypothetical protein
MLAGSAGTYHKLHNIDVAAGLQDCNLFTKVGKSHLHSCNKSCVLSKARRARPSVAQLLAANLAQVALHRQHFDGDGLHAVPERLVYLSRTEEAEAGI